MNRKICLGAPSALSGDANRVAVFIPGHLRAFWVLILLAASTTLAGCGAGGSGNQTTAATDPVGGSEVLPIDRSSPDDSAGADTDADSDSEEQLFEPSSTVGADVLLVVPAGTSEVSETKTPDFKFTNLASVTATQSLEATLRASARNPVTADGGRSGLLSASNTVTEGQTGNVTVSWDPPQQNADGSNIADLAGYRVYQGNAEQLTIVQELNETGSGNRRLAQITDVASSNACFAVTAFDTSANESALGDVVCKEIIAAAPPVNNQTPDLTSVSQLSSSDGVASIRLNWNAPAQSASSSSSIVLYSVYHGSQSQLFKISEVNAAATAVASGHQYDVGGIGGEQACFALTARYNNGLETLLGDIVCVPLVHSAAPQPGDQLRPFNVSATLTGSSTAQISWDRPNTVVSSADATGIDRYDLYQGSPSQVFKIGEISETGAAGTRRTTTAENVFAGSNCFALTATDDSLRQSALSTIVCATLPSSDSGGTATPPGSSAIGVSSVSAQETSPGSVAISWDAPELIAAGQPIGNLRGYNLYQGSESQLFKVAEIDHVGGTVRQQTQRNGVTDANQCFAVTAYDRNGFEAPLSEIVCANISGTSSVPQFGIVPPTDLATSALGGSTTITLSWLASGAAITGAADPNVHLYNIYQGDHDRLFKVREVIEDHDADPRSSTMFTGVRADSACFAITAQYLDLRESRLSDIVCRDN